MAGPHTGKTRKGTGRAFEGKLRIVLAPILVLCTLLVFIPIAQAYASNTQAAGSLAQDTTTSGPSASGQKEAIMPPGLLQRVRDLVKKEDALISRENSDKDLLHGFEVCMLGEGAKPARKNVSDMRKRLDANIYIIEKGIDMLKAQWRAMDISSKGNASLLKNIELVKLEAFLLAIEEKRQYIETLDPTYKAYYMEYLKQVGIFSKRVKSLLGSENNERGPRPRSQ